MCPLTAGSAEKMLEYITATIAHRQECVNLCSLQGVSPMGLAFIALCQDCLEVCEALLEHAWEHMQILGKQDFRKRS